MKPRSSGFAILLILFFSASLYAWSANAFFVADDLWQVHYQYRTVAGEWDLLLANFTGTYLGIPGTSFYRPVLGLSFFIDYLLFGTNSTGYHLTNIIIHAGNALLVFYLSRFLETSFWSERKPGFAPLAAALLFAATPLHCEAVTWISGRADPLFTFFFLVSYLLFLHSFHKGIASPHAKILFFASISSFILALHTKETAVVLPLLIALSVVVSCLSAGEPALSAGKSASTRAKLIMVAPYIAIALGYLFLRCALFGSEDITRGYVGSFGEGLARTASLRFLDWRIWARTLLPFNSYALDALDTLVHSSYVFLAAFLAVCLGGFSTVSAMFQKNPARRLIMFLLTWELVSLIPLIGFFNIDEVLHGSRVFYLFSAPMMMCLAFALFPGALVKEEAARAGRFYKLFSSLRLAAFVVLLAAYSLGTVATNRLWVAAGERVAVIKEECLALDRQFGGRQPLLLLGIPGDYYGAFVLLNGSTIHHLFCPPFTKGDISARIFSFKPFIFGSESQLDSTRFKRVLDATASDQGVNRVYFAGVANAGLEGAFLRRAGSGSASFSYHLPVAQEASQSAESGRAERAERSGAAEVPYKVEAQGICRCKIERDGSVALHDMVGETKIKFSGLDLFPLDFDFLSLRVSTRPLEGSGPGSALPLAIGWNDSPAGIAYGAIPPSYSSFNSAHSAPASAAAPAPPVLRIGLSQYWKWYRDLKVRSLELNCGAASRIELSDMALVKDVGIRPFLKPPSIEERSTGEFVLRDRRKQIAFDFDLNGVEPVAFVRFEVSQPDCFFENFPGSGGKLAMTRKLPVSAGGFTLPVSLLHEGAYSQVRILCLDKEGRSLGVYSDPITVFLNRARPSTYLY